MAKAKGKRETAEESRLRARHARIEGGFELLRTAPTLAGTLRHVGLSYPGDGHLTDGWAYIAEDPWRPVIVVNDFRDADPEEWAWVFAHLLVHLGLGHTRALLAEDGRLAEPSPQRDVLPDRPLSVAACVAAHRFDEVVKAGHAPILLPVLPSADELALARRWRTDGIPTEFMALGVAGHLPCFRLSAHDPTPGGMGARRDYRELFARSLAEATRSAMADAAGQRGVYLPGRSSSWDDALGWFVSSYPLLGALATGMTIVADRDLARAWEISVAAVSAEAGEIYVNPNARLTDEEWRFVLAHELLHAALRHDKRQGGRDPYLFNVAADYAINGWLIEMGVGVAPEGVLHDSTLAGLSAESIYDTLVTDLRRARKLRTLGGRNAGDVLGPWLSEPQAAQRRGSRRAKAAVPWDHAAWGRDGPAHATDLDAFYRRALSTGLAYHERANRGLLPAGLVEEIRALEHPPLDWDAKLARWFDEHVPANEPVRSYARASRRQAATPDIPRPGRVRPEQLELRVTFGVVLDTSGSMETHLLGKALGAIASYAAARDVPAARVVFCDATAYDAGYLSVDDIAGKVRVRGRGGTVLQPGVRLLEQAVDFPSDGPILIITDGMCNTIRTRREHAFLIPRGAQLPFRPAGPVFEVR